MGFDQLRNHKQYHLKKKFTLFIFCKIFSYAVYTKLIPRYFIMHLKFTNLMVGRRRKCFISNRLKRLEELSICRRQIMQVSIINREFIKKLFRDCSQSLKIFKVYGYLKFTFLVINIFNYKS